MNNNENIPRELGAQLVDIVYSNTNLNYDAVASNLVLVFQHLSLKLPDLKNLSNSLVDSIKVINYTCVSWRSLLFLHSRILLLRVQSKTNNSTRTLLV